VKRVVLLVAGASLALATVFAPAPQAQATAPAVALVNARVIDGTGRPAIDKSTIVIVNGRIDAVGPASSVKVPSGAQRIDESGKTIVPGFINAHAHLNVERNATLPVRDDLVRRLKTYAMYGITSTVSLGSTMADEMTGFDLMHEQDHPALDRARLYSAGMNAIGKTPEEARASVDRLSGLHAQVIKFHINGNPNDMPRPVWSAIIDEAHKKNMKVAVHIYYIKDAQAAVDDGVDILAHSIRDGDVPASLVAEMKQKNVAYIPTLTRDLSVFVYETTPDFFKDPFFLRGRALYNEQVPMLSTDEWHAKVAKDPTTEMIRGALVQANKNLKTLSDSGITIGMGTDSGVANNPGRWQGYFEQVEMEMMNKAGMTPMQVITAATGNAAKIMQVTDTGTLEKGKWADLVVLRGNPLQNILNTRTIDAVWIGGAKLADLPPVTSTK
jgi:imidazolonepropionase-like amidohydrolase